MNNCVYINLDRRPDRRAHIEHELKMYGFTAPKRIAGVEEKPPFGCQRAHIAALDHAIKQGWSSVLVFEDDFEFYVSPREFLNILEKTAQLPMDAFMLATTIHKAEDCEQPDFVAVKKSTNGAGYYIHNRALLVELRNLFVEGLERLRAGAREINYINDVIWFKLMETYKWYASRVTIGRQANFESNNR